MRIDPIDSRGILATAAFLMVALFMQPSQAQTHKDEHPGGTAHRLELDHGKKWATDEPLRKGMGEIRNLIAASEPGFRKGKLAQEDYAALGTKIEQQVAYIVANCKLEPRADENLHVVLSGIISGADAMQGKDTKVTAAAGARKVIAGLNSYGRYFDHPGWKRL